MQIITQTDQELLKQLSVELMEAWKNADAERLRLLTHKDFCLISDMVKDYCLGREKWIDMLTGKFQLINYHYAFHKIKLRDNGNMASVISKLSIFSLPNYTGVANLYLVTDIWVKNNEVWKLMIRQPVASPLIQ